MRRTSIALAAAAAACSLAPTLGCASRGRAYQVVPAPGPSYTIHDGVVEIETSAFRLSLLVLDESARRAFIESRARGAQDPFGRRPGGPPRYLTFKLSVENRGQSEPVIFQPQSIFLASERGDRLYPIDYPEAYRRFAGIESTDPRLLQDLSKYLFDVSVSVPPGAAVENLLIYPALKTHARKLRMEFNFIQTGGSDVHHYDVFYLRERRPG